MELTMSARPAQSSNRVVAERSGNTSWNTLLSWKPNKTCAPNISSRLSSSAVLTFLLRSAGAELMSRRT
jgi:hypothetical protein